MVKQLIIGDVMHELASTRRILERLPEEHITWMPHVKSMTVGGLATHLTNLLNWQLEILLYPELDLSTDRAASAGTIGKTRRRARGIRR